MSDNAMKIMCPKCMEESEYEYPNNMMFVKKDDFTTDLLNQGFTKGYNKAIDDFSKVLLNMCKQETKLDSDGFDYTVEHFDLHSYIVEEIAKHLKEGVKNE